MSGSTASRAPALGLIAIIAFYLAIGIQYAALTPAWQVPDEPAHYNYIRRIATTGAFPVLRAGDYDQAYLSELTSTGFPPDKPIDSLQYEGHQPPLYYLLMTPVFLLTGGNLFALRLSSLLLGAGVIAFAFLAARELFPGESIFALTAAGFVAFVPQHMAMMAGVNNDSLAELLIGLSLFLALRVIRSGIGDYSPRSAAERGWRLRSAPVGLEIGAGLVIGLAFLTKTTAYIVAPVIGTAILLKGNRERFGIGEYARALALVFLPALALGALWWGRNLAVYGWPDFLGLGRHAAVVAGQPRAAEWIARFGVVEFAGMLVVTTFHSFWGQFGWMGVVMDERVYWGLGAFSIFVIAGIGMHVLTRPPAHLLTRERDSALLLITSFLFTLALFLYYNLTFVQHQGRYLFPALVPIGIGASIGLAGWTHIIESRSNREDAKTAKTVIAPAIEIAATKGEACLRRLSPRRRTSPCVGAVSNRLPKYRTLSHAVIPLGALAFLAALDLFALYRFILPTLR